MNNRPDLPLTLSAAQRDVIKLRARVEALEEALRIARRTIMESEAVDCTVWVPHDVSPAETLVDLIDAVLEKG